MSKACVNFVSWFGSYPCREYYAPNEIKCIFTLSPYIIIVHLYIVIIQFFLEVIVMKKDICQIIMKISIVFALATSLTCSSIEFSYFYRISFRTNTQCFQIHVYFYIIFDFNTDDYVCINYLLVF